MGVPKFFRYISERYPNLSELVGTKELPQFDNMYLDMNGIIHNCSHPDDSNVHFRITEEQIFRDIFRYIDTLFRLIRPQKLFFMAVDGVAPRAKMNQQRGRRFRSAKEAIDLVEKAKQKGETLPTESRFDSNCITPGTAFMARLQDALKHFVKVQLSTDPAWQHCRIILSGHETPGEGEHKIMEYIRYLKSNPDYDPNTRHCLYGLDADLIMLGLCTHELQFSLLREEVKFDKKAKRSTSVDEIRFYLLHLGLLRDYLDLEFRAIKGTIGFDYDIERIIDDWIFMCFMVGNDFIPHLPNLHINSDALPILYKTYMAVLPDIDGYINEAGQLNLARLEVFMGKLSEVDRNMFKENYEDLKFMEADYNNAETFDVDPKDILSADTKADLDALVKNTMLDFGSSSEGSISGSINEDLDSDYVPDELDDDEESESDDDDDGEEENDDELDDDKLFEKEFRLHKRNYYITKMHYPEMTKQVLAEQTECYITALQWTLSYYYRGVCSWGWFYPHHYAPYISDIQNFKGLNIKLDMGRPFLPFQQLLAVLPAHSKEHLPSAYHNLMTQSNSPVIDYYPLDFETDLNGKKQDWEAVVLIPFIDETRLISAMGECEADLSEGERARNIHGPMLQYDHADKDQGPLPDSPYGQAGLAHLLCEETPIERDDIQVPDDALVLGPCENSDRDAYFPGFPTMRHLKHSAELRMERVKVFEQPSRNTSVIVRIDEIRDELSTEALAEKYLGKEVYIGWPHLREAQVIAVSDANVKITKSSHGLVQSDSSPHEFKLLVKQLLDHHLVRMGIDLGEITQLFHVHPLLNREYVTVTETEGKFTLAKKWSKVSLAVAPQTIVENIKVHKRALAEYRSFEEVFTRNSTVFMMNNVYYGSQGTIVDPTIRSARLKISVMVHPQPDFEQARRIYYEDGQTYVNSYIAASSIGMANRLFNRITGTVLIVTGEKRFPISEKANKQNVGLQIKFPKHNEELVGYTRHLNYNNQWSYSQDAIDLVNAYWHRFPRLFELINRSQQNEFIFESELNENSGETDGSVLRVISKWLKEQPHQNARRRNWGTEALDSDSIAAIVEATNKLKDEPIRSIRLQVKPHLLYKPNLNDITVMPDASATFELFDRVVIARDGYSVPLGTRGTIISIQPMVDANPVRQENVNAVEYFYDVLFDTPFESGQSIADIAEKRLMKVRQSVLLNITHGIGRHIDAKNDNKRTQYAQSPVQQSNQKMQSKRSSDANKHEEVKNWSALFNGHSKDKRNNRDADKATKSRHQQPSTSNWRDKPDFVAKRDSNRQYPSKQSSPPNVLNDNQQMTHGNTERTMNVHQTSLGNIPLPKQFMELSLLEKQTKANVQSNQMRNASVNAPTASGNNANEAGGDSSDALRRLLRISDQTSTSAPSKELPSFDLRLNKSLIPPYSIEVPVQLLPKPPSDWTGKEKKLKAEKPNNSNNSSQQPNQMPVHPLPMSIPLPFMNTGFPFPQPPQPPQPLQPQQPPQPQFMPPQFRGQMTMFIAPPMNTAPLHPGMMRPFMNSSVRMGMGPQIAANFNAFPSQMSHPPLSQPMHHLIKQGPVGPQNLSNNSKHPPGHGAFIPLQAIRKSAKPAKGANVASKFRPPPTEQEVLDKIEQFKEEIKSEDASKDEPHPHQQQHKQPQQSQPQINPTNKGGSSKPQSNKHDVPRPQRLACKFNLPPS